MTTGPVMGGVEWLLPITLSLLWGGSFFFTEVALVELLPLTIVLGRVGLAAGALLLLVTISGQRLPSAQRRSEESPSLCPCIDGTEEARRAPPGTDESFVCSCALAHRDYGARSW